MNDNQNMNGNLQSNDTMQANITPNDVQNSGMPEVNVNPTVVNPNKDDFVSSVLADAYTGQENTSQGAVNMAENANMDYAPNGDENIGPTDHLVAPSYVSDPEVLESLEQAKKGSVTVSKELKLIIIISMIMLRFIL